MAHSFEEIPNAKQGDRRGTKFLVSNPPQKFINAQEAFDQLDGSDKKHILTTNDYFTDGFHQPKRHHGWDKSEFGGRYQECYVFKLPGYRFYGFLCNPRTKDKGYRIFVMVHATDKNVHQTDEKILKKVEEIRSTLKTVKAIKEYSQ